MSAKALATVATLAAVSLGAATGWYVFQNNDLTQAVEALEQNRTELRLANQQLERDNNNLESRNSRLQQNLDQLSSETESTTETVETLSSRVDELEMERSTLQAERDELETERTALQEERDELDAQLTTLTSELETLREQLRLAEATVEQRGTTIMLMEEELLSTQANLADIHTELESTRQRLQGREETLSELNTRLEREQQALTELENRLGLAEEERQQLVEQTESGATLIKLPERILFDTGSAELGQEASSVLSEIATVIDSFPDYTISIVGHSDSRSISPSLQSVYPTNWELSAARASAAVRELARLGVEENRMKATGVASTQPLVEEVDNATRAQNRRIEIILEPPLDTEVLAGN